MQRHYSDGSDRWWRLVRPVIAGKTCDELTNVAREGSIGADAHMVVLGLAGHIELPRRRDVGGTTGSRLEKLGQKRKDKKIKVVYLIDWIPSIGRDPLYL